jgi:DNA processing protein
MEHRLGITDLEVGNRAHERIAVVALLRAKVVQPYELSSILEYGRSAVELVRMSEDDRLFKPERTTHQFIGAVTQRDLDRAAVDLNLWVDRGHSFSTILEADYPLALRSIFNRPPMLFVEGRWDDDRYAPALAIVGTRQASEAGLRRAARLSRELIEAGFPVLSGMAAGIDTAAHNAALEAGGLTAAVMGTGIAKRFPAENAELASRILAAGGCLISQFFPDQHPTKWTFPHRNVVMSGLALGTIVIEASETSGARMQARVAMQHGRTVFLLRSLVESHAWARKYVEDGAYGTHAIPVSSTSEIVDRYQATDAPVLQIAS